LFVPASVDSSVPEQRIVEACQVMPEYAGVTGWAQLRWAGGRWFDGVDSDGRTERPVVVVTPLTDVRPQPGVQISGEHLDVGELVWQDGLRTTTCLRSLLFEVRVARTLWLAVRAIDLAAFSDLVSIAEFVEYVGHHAGWPGIRQARSACQLADENTWSPRETWLRWVWMCEAGFPRPLMNQPVFDLAGNHIGTPDLLDVEAGLVGEYEGVEAHLNQEARHHDIKREDAFRSVGLEYFTAVGRDAGNRTALAARMAAARSRARWLPAEQRLWTVIPPAWWVPTVTVDQRRALTPAQRQRWLAHRQ
jgi:hypothetical protein